MDSLNKYGVVHVVANDHIDEESIRINLFCVKVNIIGDGHTEKLRNTPEEIHWIAVSLVSLPSSLSLCLCLAACTNNPILDCGCSC